MELSVLRCPQCGAEGRLTRREENGAALWHCAHCGGKFTEESKVREYERLEATIKSSLGSVITEALLREKTEKYYNLRSMLWEKINAKYIDSKAIISICRDIKKLDPQDFLAQFFELANSADEADVADFVNNIDVYENEVFIDLVIDFLLKSMCEEYIAPVNLLIERAYRGHDLKKLGEYMTRLEEEALKIDADMYETKVPRDVFIAYSSKDMDTVLELMRELEDSGLSCFAAFRNLQHGRNAVANYESALKEAIDNCKILVFVSSKNSRTFRCDAFDKELSYIRECDLAANPIYRNNYEALPQEQRKPRVEYRLDDSRSVGADAFMKEFFAGLDYCETLEKTVLRVIQCKKALANPAARFEEARNAGKIHRAEEVRGAVKQINVSVGATLTFGSYQQNGGKQPIEWIVLAKNGSSALMISKYLLDCKPYNTTRIDTTWETSSLRSWLNGDFMREAFTAAEQGRILTTKVSTPNNTAHGTVGGNSTNDKIYLLSIEEARQYFASNDDRKCVPTAYAASKGAYKNKDNGCSPWWMRSPGNNQDYAADVSSDGYAYDVGTNVNFTLNGVRPALWVNFESAE
ncbi:MAG: TIR domain-containing protein [Ruminococcaceae bacterium]|nr:TIR domain-containing protein [Oscillospiraceae bacterium]